MLNKFKKYHSSIFAFISFLGFQLLIFEVNFSYVAFIVTMIIMFIVLIVEALISLQFAKNIQSKLALPQLVDNIKHIHISHHILLPSLIYIETCGFIFFNSLNFSCELIIILSSICYFTIFEGQRKSFINEFTFSENLHNIYDATKIIIYFIGVHTILQFWKYFDLNIAYPILIIQALAFILFILIIIRKEQSSTLSILYMFIASTVISLFSAITTIFISDITYIALISTAIYYIFIGYIHHKINATLSSRVIIEYIAILLIIFITIVGLSS